MPDVLLCVHFNSLSKSAIGHITHTKRVTTIAFQL